MPLDGLMLYSLKTELKQNLINSKIDKIMQPEKDEINIVFRKERQNFNLIISASPNFPRICLTKQFTKENPIKAPMFLMVLRKHILGGRVISIEQKELDRILKINIMTLNELKENIIKSLYIEIMGKHSNIILVNDEENKIIDSIKKIPMTISSFRQVLPNVDYVSPPVQNKLNPMDINEFNLFKEKILSLKDICYKSIYKCFYGISPIIAKEICYLSDIDNKALVANLKENQFENLYKNFITIINSLKKHDFFPNIIFDESNDKIIDFSCINLSLYQNDMKIIKYDSCNEACYEYYSIKDLKDRITQRTRDIKKIICHKIITTERKIKKQQLELNLTENMDKYKHEADLLTSYIYLIKPGDNKIIVNDFYNDNSPEVEILLNPNLSPSENIQALYKKYNKLKNRKKELFIQIENAKKELDYIYNLEQSIENISSKSDIEEIIDEMKEQNLIKRKSSKNKSKKISKPLHYISSDGNDIFVGKNNTQNDFLTLKIANKDDIWLHVKNSPGSHVIIKNEPKVTEKTLLEAANLAAYYSKIRNSCNVPIDYTEKKNVKKPNGAKPGMVIYTTNSTIYINPDKKIINNLKKIEN